MPANKDDFRRDLLALSEEEVVRKYYFETEPAHLSVDDITHAARMLGAAFQIDIDDIGIVVSGSARLGFTTVDKTDESGRPRPAYTDFDAESDIDLAIVSPRLFQAIWNELSYYASRQNPFPWSHRRLGDYLISGWLRPDHFPKVNSLPYVGEWWPTFDRISRQTRFGRRKVRGGLFHSEYQLQLYLRRAVRQLKMAEELR